MSSWEPPEDHREEEEDAGGPHRRKMPDFIYVDIDRGPHGRKYEEFSQHFSESLEEIKGKHYPFGARILCFITALFILFLLVLLLPFLFIFFLINLLTGFKITPFWNQTKRAWETIKKISVLMTGLAIAVFSPILGFSVLIVYFFMTGKEVDDQFVARFMKSHFERR
ncbi:MAG: hypothetical protein WB791_07085 [Waddliaceae bacterium]